MALTVALELIGGEVFKELSESVIRAVDRKAAFIDLLRDMKYLLLSLKSKADIFQRIQQLNLELSLPVDEIIALGQKVSEGKQLVDRLSATNFCFWNFCCTNEGAEQLTDLRNSLDRLLQGLQLEQVRDGKETLLLTRENRDDIKKILNILEKLQIHNPEVDALLKKLPEQRAGNSMEASGSNTENEGKGKGKAQVESLEGLVEAAFLVLSDVVVQVTDKTMMFRPFLRRLKSTLDFLKPFIEDIVHHNKVLDRPKEELENLRIQIIKGVKLVGECSKVHQRTCSNEKYKYTDQLFELDESLQWQLSILLEHVARDVRETSSLIRNIQEVVKKIEGSRNLQNQVEFKGFCDTAEPPILTVELEAMNLQRIRGEMKETFSTVNMNKWVRGIEGGDEVLEVAQPQPPTVVLNMQGTGEVEVKETLDSTTDVEDDLKEIEGSAKVLEEAEHEPPTVELNEQRTSEEEEETLDSTRDLEEDFREIEGSDEVLRVAEPQPPTVELDVPDVQETRDDDTLDSVRGNAIKEEEKHKKKNNGGCSKEFQAMLDSYDQEDSGEEILVKKRHLSSHQVKALEMSFEVENKLEPERKLKLAAELGLQPRQVAIWFQNRRARWKTKQLERDYSVVKADYDALKHNCDGLDRQNRARADTLKDLKAKQCRDNAESGQSVEEESPSSVYKSSVVEQSRDQDFQLKDLKAKLCRDNAESGQSVEKNRQFQCTRAVHWTKVETRI